MKRLLLFAVFFITLIFAEKANASHVMGSDIVYRCLGNGRYEITLRVYRDCNGAILSGAPVVATCGSNTISVSQQQKVSQRDITGIDGNCTVQSRCAGSSFPYGVEEHIWKMTLDLSNQTCCEWTLSWQMCCRNGNITTGQANQNFYTTATLNKCVTPCNSSPDFTNPPVAIICHNQDFIFNNGALDTIDIGDSLSYELVNGFTGPGSSVTYSGQFSPQRPLTFWGFPNNNLNWPAGFHLDPITGDLLFRPIQINQVAIVVIEVKEWRLVNGTMQVVGRTRRDMQIIIVACPGNAPPTIGGTFVNYACAGETICVSITTNDVNTGDTVRISWNAGIRGASFTNNNGTTNHARGEVCWTPNDNQVSNIPYTFTITARDNACPLAGQSVRAFSIYVRESPKGEAKAHVLNCGYVALEHKPTKNSYPGYQYEIELRDSLNTLRWRRPRGAVTAGTPTWDTAFLQPGKYTMIVNQQTNTPCFNVLVDTFEIPEFVRITANDTFVCDGFPLTIPGLPRGGNTPYQYKWWNASDTAATSLSTSKDLTATPDSFTKFVVRIRDNNGCQNWDTVNVNWRPIPEIDLGADQRICKGNMVTLDAGTDGLEQRFQWSTGDSTRTVYVTDSMDVWARVADTFGCFNYDTIEVRVNNPIPEAGSNAFRCQGDTIRLEANGTDTYQWFFGESFNPNGPFNPISTNAYYDYVVTQSRTLVVRGTQTYKGVTCTGIDSVRVTMNPLPEIIFNPKGPHCVDGGPIPLLTYLEFPTLFTGTFRSDANPSFVADNVFLPSLSGPSVGPNQHQVIYRVVDGNGCVKEAATRVNILPLPEIRLQDSIVLCGDAPELQLNTLIQAHNPPMALGTPTWSSLNNNPVVNNNIVTNPPNNQKLTIANLPQNTVYPILYNYRNNTSNCSNQDTVYVRVKEVPNVNAGVLPPSCWNDPEINLSSANATPAGGTWSSTQIPLNGTNTGFTPSSVGEANKFATPGTQVTFTYTVNKEGCTKAADVTTTVRGLPNIVLTPLLGVCEDTTTIDLTNRGTPYSFGAGEWTGSGVTANSFNAADAGPGYHRLEYNYTHPSTGCKNMAFFQTEVQELPSLQFQSPSAACAGRTFDLKVAIENAPGFTWGRVGDGSFDAEGSGNPSSNNLTTEYFPGPSDIANGGVVIFGQTTMPGYCKPAELAQYIEIFPIPNISIEEPLDGCDTLDVVLKANTDAAPGFYLTWDLGDGNTVDIRDSLRLPHTYQGPGVRTINLVIHSDSAFGYCRNEATPVNIEVFPTPVAAIGTNRKRTSVALPEIQFTDKSTIDPSGVIDYWFWSFGDRFNSTSSLQNPLFSYPNELDADTGAFPVILQVRTPQGCESFAYDTIYIQPDITVFIPNAFTPNNFGEVKNDRFFVVADGYENFEISIFSRWGEMVYYSTDINHGWDGMFKGVEAQQDVYIYVVRVTSIAGKQYEYYGTITLLR